MMTKIERAVNLMNHDELIEEFILVTEALTDVVDGQDSHDLVYITGFSQERCDEICKIAYKYTGE